MIITRYDKNPILIPKTDSCWEAYATFNGCPIKKDKEIYLIYRAMSCNEYHRFSEKKINLSSIGIAKSFDGINFKERKLFIYPQESWEKFGCEDPRVTKIDGLYYIFYTALSQFPFNANGIKVAVAISKDLKTIEKKELVTPFNAKAMTLFPEKINKKIVSVFTYKPDTPNPKICFAIFDKKEDIYSRDFWEKWYNKQEEFILDIPKRPQDHIEIGSPPIKTEHGWILFYSYIYDFFTTGDSSRWVFSIDAVLLDLKDPKKRISKTKGPILTPEEYYEKYGLLNNIVFPSGAIIKDDKIYVYYGASDTTCCLAFIDLKSFLDHILPNKLEGISFKRFDKNPILEPIKEHKWENRSTFNPAAIYLGGKVHIIYRAVSDENISVLGYATSKNGYNIDYRSQIPIYVPRRDFEKSGCEDPRLTKIDGYIYMLYTAYDVNATPRVALTKIKEKDFLKNKWNWSEPILISPPGFSDKDACIFPEKIKGKYYILHRMGNEIDLSVRDDLDFKEKNAYKYLEENNWVKPRKGWWDYRKVGCASPPIKTKKGWILLYHGIAMDHSYTLGALLLDLKNPYKIIARTDEPIFKPEADYEKVGDVPNVVFPCGSIVKDGLIFIYYGGGDKVTGVATLKLKILLDKLKLCRC
jgi:beta-1,2-mannobiose phosphorylase / 1,2-beta-oligomannan phosphorylase